MKRFLMLILLSFLSSLSINASIIFASIIFFFKEKKLKSIFDIDSKAHAIHKEPIPRIGGLGIFIGFLTPALWLHDQFSLRLALVSSLVFLIGFVEDLVKSLSPKLRLLLLLLIAILSIEVLNIKITSIGIIKISYIFSIILTTIAIAGYTNATNIIDGLNGLSSGISFIFLLFLGITFLSSGFPQLAYLCFSLNAAILGFLIFNFPKGKIFLGDGGAYFLGFICAVLSIKVINSNPSISPWFPLILGIYPVWEVFFSAYRRKKKEKHPFSPDKLHFHTLLYLRGTKSNPKASAMIILVLFIFSCLAFLFKTCHFCLIVEFVIFVLIYMKAYNMLMIKHK